MAPASWLNLDLHRRRFLEQAAVAAQRAERETGVPACITMAQACLESNWGKSTAGGSNYFGIKADRRWTGPISTVTTKEYSAVRKLLTGNGWYTVIARFRKYADMAASFADHGRFLRDNRRYRRLFDLPASAYRTWAYGLQSAGYATDPRYAEKLIGIIERYELKYLNLPPVPPAA